MPLRRFSIRFSLAYALMMLGTGVQLPFLPLWLSAKGVSVTGIATIVACMSLVRVVATPGFAWAVDHFGHRRGMIRACAALAFASYASLTMLDGFWPIAAACLVAASLFAPVFPLSEGYAVDASHALCLDYGKMRLWASLSFLAGSLGSGWLLTRLDPLDTAWLLAGAMGFTVISAFILPPEPGSLRRAREEEPEQSATRFLFASSFPLFLVAAGLAQASHGLQNSFSSVYWQSLGYQPVTIGALWAVAVIAEVVLLGVSTRLVNRLGPGPIFLMGIGGGFIRWSLAAFASSLPLIAALQILHAASFAMTHLGTMHMIRLVVPANLRNRAQGMHSALSGGLLMSGSIWASGPLYSALGAHAYLPMALLSAMAMVLAVSVMRVSPTMREAAAA
jgi:MFS transporter, PPP family, 3-phenylpropionic acid transporter